MKTAEKVDLGSIQVHKKVIAELAVTAVSELEGIRLVSGALSDKVMQAFGKISFPGVRVTVDKDNQVTVEVKILIPYGKNIQEIAKHIQDTVRAAIEKTVDINLKEINVNIQGIERGKK